MNYSEILNLMKNPVSMESKRKKESELSGTSMVQTGQILVNGKQIGECSGQGAINVLRYGIPGKKVVK